MTLSNLSRKECVETYPVNNYYDILNDPRYENEFPLPPGTTKSTNRTIDDEINRTVTKIKYSKVAAFPPKRNLPTVDPEPVIPSKSVFLHSNYSRVSELEKILSVFTKQMLSVLQSGNCSEGLTVLEDFQNAINSTNNLKQNIQFNENNEHFTI